MLGPGEVRLIASGIGLRLENLGKFWGWALRIGVISIAIGILALVWPAPALLAVALLFGGQLVVAGVFRFVQACAVLRESVWLRAVAALLALISFAVGLFLLRHPVYSVLILVMLLGLLWMLHGVAELFAAFGHSGLPTRIWQPLSGIVSIIAGAIVLFVSGISLVALTVVPGVCLILFGATLLVGAMSARSMAR